MKKTHRSQSRPPPKPRPETWRNSETLFLLNCYDVWSATPPRGKECTSPVPAAR